MAEKILKQLLAEAIATKSALGDATDLTVTILATVVAASITGPGVVPIVVGAIGHYWISSIEAVSEASLTAAYNDPLLFPDIMCAIYCGLDGATEFDQLNLADIIARIMAIDTTHTEQLAGLATFFSEVGIYALNSLANVAVYSSAYNCVPCECETPEPLPCDTTEDAFTLMESPNLYDGNTVLSGPILAGAWSGGTWTTRPDGQKVYNIAVGGVATYTLEEPARVNRINVRTWDVTSWSGDDWPDWLVYWGDEEGWSAGSKTKISGAGGYYYGHEYGIVGVYGQTVFQIVNQVDHELRVYGVTFDQCLPAE